MTPRLGSLDLQSARERPELLARPVLAAILGPIGNQAFVAEIDPGLADTAALTAAHGLDPEDSANCVIVLGKRRRMGAKRKRSDISRSEILALQDRIKPYRCIQNGHRDCVIVDNFVILFEIRRLKRR